MIPPPAEPIDHELPWLREVVDMVLEEDMGWHAGLFLTRGRLLDVRRSQRATCGKPFEWQREALSGSLSLMLDISTPAEIENGWGLNARSNVDTCEKPPTYRTIFFS